MRASKDKGGDRGREMERKRELDGWIYREIERERGEMEWKRN